jgi:hypothetical protein
MSSFLFKKDDVMEANYVSVIKEMYEMYCDGAIKQR